MAQKHYYLIIFIYKNKKYTDDFPYAKPVRLNTSLYILYLLYFYTKYPEQAPTLKPDLLSTHPELIAAFLSKRAAGRHSRMIYF